MFAGLQFRMQKLPLAASIGGLISAIFVGGAASILAVEQYPATYGQTIWPAPQVLNPYAPRYGAFEANAPAYRPLASNPAPGGQNLSYQTQSPTGTQIAGRQMGVPPGENWNGPADNQPAGADPYQTQPFAPQMVPAVGYSQVYEYDSFTGHVFDQPFLSESCPFSWLCPHASTNVTWIQGEGDSLGFTEFERRLLITNPLIAPFRLVPGFTTRYISGPDTVDMPGNVTELSLEFAATYQLQNAWSIDVGIMPGLYGDFKFVNYDTFRLQGHAVLSRPISAASQAVLGFVYLAREDISALPVAGVLWQPSPDVRWELVFPRPKVATRVGGFTEDGWLYLRSELGGYSWSIERANGHRDVATYRDIRLILGYEAIMPGGYAAQFEGGWVFSRKLMYASDTPDFSPRDTFMLRAGLTF